MASRTARASARRAAWRVVGQLLDQLRGLTLQDAAKLVAFISAQDWSRVDANTRFTLLHEINNVITKLREQAGLPSFDDGFPPARGNAFLIIKQLVTGKSPPV
jgi:hypothetical protein